MAFNGTWKAERNENYDKFMEQMGERVGAGQAARARFPAPETRPELRFGGGFTGASDEVARW